jgi:hypothetical protein
MVKHGRYDVGLLKNLIEVSCKKYPVRVINAQKHCKAMKNVLIGTLTEKNTLTIVMLSCKTNVRKSK